MGNLFDFKKIFNKHNGSAITIIVVIVSILMIIGLATSPSEEIDNLTPIEGLDVISGNNIPNEEIEEILYDKKDNNEIISNQIQTDLNDEIVNVEINKSTETKVVNKIDLDKQKKEELEKIPEYSSIPYCIINNNIPFFYDTDLITNSYEKYSTLDSLRKMWTCNCMYRERFNANGRKRQYWKYKAIWLAYCKIQWN